MHLLQFVRVPAGCSAVVPVCNLKAVVQQCWWSVILLSIGLQLEDTLLQPRYCPPEIIQLCRIHKCPSRKHHHWWGNRNFSFTEERRTCDHVCRTRCQSLHYFQWWKEMRALESIGRAWSPRASEEAPMWLPGREPPCIKPKEGLNPNGDQHRWRHTETCAFAAWSEIAWQLKDMQENGVVASKFPRSSPVVFVQET